MIVDKIELFMHAEYVMSVIISGNESSIYDMYHIVQPIRHYHDVVVNLLRLRDTSVPSVYSYNGVHRQKNEKKNSTCKRIEHVNEIESLRQSDKQISIDTRERAITNMTGNCDRTWASTRYN